VLAGLLPFVSSAAIGRLGLTTATALIYLAGTAVIAAALVHQRIRSILTAETAALMRQSASRRRLLLGLSGFLVAGVAYYVGLARTPRVAEYVFLTRLDWLVQAAVAVVWLREPWTGRGLVGGALALAGGLLLAWSGAFGPSGLAAAVLYVLASLVGYSCFTPLSAARGIDGAVALTVWRHWVNTAGFVVLALTLASPSPSSTPDPVGLALAGIGGLAIVVLFFMRFSALTRLPLWILSAQAPTQALVAIAISLATTGRLRAITLAGIGLVVVGEVLVTSTAERSRPRG
jgi:drug/metabolite transporter (DMT)-like permease